jgi:uncharacterized membrane protein YgcG
LEEQSLRIKRFRKKFTTFWLVILSISFGLMFISMKNAIPIQAINDGDNDGRLESSNYYYANWEENITIGMDGSLLVVEKMTFRLDPGSYGKAYRDLKWRLFHDVQSWNVIADPTTSTPAVTYVNIERSMDNIQFYWEFPRDYYPSTTDMTFILTYNVSSAMDLRGNRDRVYWNVIGTEFEVRIENINTKVFFPQEFAEEDIRSRTYYNGEGSGDDNGVVYNQSGRTVVEFNQGVVNPGEGYTIDVDSPPSGINMPFSMRVYLNTNWIISLALGFAPFFLFFIFVFIFAGIDPRVKKVPILNEVAIAKCQACSYVDHRKVEFCPLCGEQMKQINEPGPPSDLSPAEVGTLLDEKFNKIDFVAEIFYLAEKGYLKIIQTPESSEIYFLRTAKHQIKGNLSKFDQMLLENIEDWAYDTLWFKTNEKPVEEKPVDVTSLSTIKTNAYKLWNKRSLVYEKLSGGETDYFVKNPDKIRGRYERLAIFSSIGGGILFFLLADRLYVQRLLFGILGVVIAGIIGFFLSRKMPKLTKEGAKMKASWEGYLQIIRGEMLGFPDPYRQFNYSMDHFAYLLVNPGFNLPKHLQRLSKDIKQTSPPIDYHYVAPYWYYYPRIYVPTGRGVTHRTITGLDSVGRGFQSVVDGISNIAESLPEAISNMSEGLTNAISNMSEGFTPPSSSGGSSGFGGGFSGGGGGGGGGGIG